MICCKRTIHFAFLGILVSTKLTNAAVYDDCSSTSSHTCDASETCTNDRCVCASGYVNSGTAGTCVANDCPAPGTVCTGIDNRYCASSNNCECNHLSIEVTTAIDNTLGTCIADDCNTNTDCLHHADNVRCDTTNHVCVCDTTYILKAGVCTAKGIGDACADATECVAVTDAICLSTTCQCPSGTSQYGTACRIGNGDDCTGSLSDKCVDNAECTDDKCACSSGYKDDGSKLCIAVLGSSCGHVDDCAAVNNSTCDSTCKCSSGFTQDGVLCITESSESSAAGIVGSVVLLLGGLLIAKY